MANREMSSRNADTAFVSNCDHDYNCMAHIYSKYCVVFQRINVLHSIMGIMLQWISERLKMDRIIATI